MVKRGSLVRVSPIVKELPFHRKDSPLIPGVIVRVTLSPILTVSELAVRTGMPTTLIVAALLVVDPF